jgi:hypothetical protein
MATGIEGSLTPAEVAEAFTQMLADERYQVELKHFLPEGPSTEARVLVQQGDTYVLGVGRWTDDGPQEGALELVMRRTGRTWEWRGGGSCNLLGPVLAPADSRVVLSAPAGGLDSSSTTVTLLVHELQCAGAREPDPYLHEPDVTESDDSVVVTWTSDAITSEATCPGNPSVERTITLSEPLGDRPLLDGSYYPPRPVVPADPMGAGQ